MCTNTQDFFTMEEIKDLPHYQFLVLKMMMVLFMDLIFSHFIIYINKNLANVLIHSIEHLLII